MLHRGFIHLDLIFALLRVEPRTPKGSFFFRGAGTLKKGSHSERVFGYFGQVIVPYPPGFMFPDPNMTTGFATGGGTLDPYLWLWAIQDTDSVDIVRAGKANHVMSSRGEIFSYNFVIPGDPRKRKPEFEYENHSQNGKFRMHSLAWIGFANSSTSGSAFDTLTFSCFGVWIQNGVEKVVQAAVQVSKSRIAPWIGIQIARAEIGDVDSPLPQSVFPVPLPVPTGKPAKGIGTSVPEPMRW